ncbi:MAG: NADH-quinone oxidoreductase subunit N, partial [Planctomycetota bacterium]
MSEWNVALALPEWILAATAVAAMLFDVHTPAGRKRAVERACWMGVALATAAVLFQGWRLWGLGPGGALFAFRGHYGLDPFAVLLKVVFGVCGLTVLALARTWLPRVDRGHGEFQLLLVLAILGMFFVCSVEDFAGLFVALELITVSFYCLTAFKRNDERAIEAGLKYVVLGALASGFLVLGIAFVYGATGSLRFSALAQADVVEGLEYGGAPLLTFGLLLVLVGLGFKLAAVPFQVWTPDVYEGAASPVTAFLSVGSKTAGVALLLKVLRACLGPAGDIGLARATPWILLLAGLSAATLLYGSLGALWQTNVKRLLGYSSIGHAGYVLMGVVALDRAGFAAVLYYLMAYLFTVLAVFGVVVAVNGATRSHRIADYAGLARRSPLLAFVMLCGLLSLAGVPPFGGFFGKFLVFQAVVAKGAAGPGATRIAAYALAFVGAAGVVISLYYYLAVVKRLYMEPGTDAEPIPVPPRLKAALY